MSDENVLTFDLKLKKQRKRGVKNQAFNRCSHSQMLADEHHKVLECEKCGFVMSAWEYVWQIAKKEENIFNHLKYTKYEQVRLNDEVTELKRIKHNLQSQVNRMNKKLI
jgi:ribosomal protein S27AE